MHYGRNKWFCLLIKIVFLNSRNALLTFQSFLLASFPCVFFVHVCICVCFLCVLICGCSEANLYLAKEHTGLIWNRWELLSGGANTHTETGTAEKVLSGFSLCMNKN